MLILVKCGLWLVATQYINVALVALPKHLSIEDLLKIRKKVKMCICVWTLLIKTQHRDGTPFTQNALYRKPH